MSSMVGKERVVVKCFTTMATLEYLWSTNTINSSQIMCTAGTRYTFRITVHVPSIRGTDQIQVFVVSNLFFMFQYSSQVFMEFS